MARDAVDRGPCCNSKVVKSLLLAAIVIGLTAVGPRLSRESYTKEMLLHTTKPSVIDEESSTKEETWTRVKDRLCAQGVPNVSLGASLFLLARKALDAGGGGGGGDGDDEDDLARGTLENTQMVQTFYTGYYGGSHEGGASFYMKRNTEGRTTSSMMYLSIYKCGSDFIRQWLQNVFKKHKSSDDDDESSSVFIKDIHPRQAMALWQQQQQQEHQTMNTTNVSTIVSSPPPCIVTAIRDPIHHFLSGYNEIEYRIVNHIIHSKSSSRRPPSFLDVTNTTTEWKQERFKTFVRDILYRDFDDFKGLAPLHVFPMSRVLSALAHDRIPSSSEGRKDDIFQLNAYLSSLDNLKTTWPTFLESACPDLPPLISTRDPAGMGVHNSSVDELGFYQAAQQVWRVEQQQQQQHQGDDVARALCVLHAMDYACWADLPDGIPALCRDVYAESHFVNTILQH
jgi:hypothetical protein